MLFRSYRPPGISFAIGLGGDIDHGDVDEKVVPPAACRLKCRPRPGRSGEGVRTGAKRAEAGVVLTATARPEDRTCTKKGGGETPPPNFVTCFGNFEERMTVNMKPKSDVILFLPKNFDVKTKLELRYQAGEQGGTQIAIYKEGIFYKE